MILFYDTETTGMIKNWNIPIDGSDNIPNIVQLGWALFTRKGQHILSTSNIIKPNGWTIEPQAEAIHGISLERCEAEGISIQDALKPFCFMHQMSDCNVAHNHNFDSKIVRAELIRLESKYTREHFKSQAFKCTMMETTSFCKLRKPNGRGGYKWPKLEELHEKLFNEPMANAHDALGDVMSTSKCFFELVKRGIIEL